MTTTETAAEYIARQKAQLPRRLRPMPGVGGRGSFVWSLERETFREQSNYPLKLLSLQRLRLLEIRGEPLRPDMGSRVGELEYRLGYHIVNESGKWGWGQSAPMMPPADLEPLLEQARAEETLL